MLIKRAVLLDGSHTDIRVGSQITEMAEELVPTPGEAEFDAAGGTVIPGLHDHHIHLRAAAAALHSVRVGPDEVHGKADLARVLAGASAGKDGWVRAVGYHDAAAGPLDRHVLDGIAPRRPARIQHRSGVLWTLNSAALRLIGLGDHPDGRLRSSDGSWAASLSRGEPDLAGLSAQLSRYGVTGVTDATPDLATADIPGLQALMHQRVYCLAPGKRILHDDELDLDELVAWIGERHTAGVPVALHCVTAPQLVVALTALRDAGRRPGDRIEHAAVVPDDCLAGLASSATTVVTQPNFVAERGDQYAVDVPVAEQHELWRVASLRRAGVPVALSTDAPFGDADPWACMRAAVSRRTQTGTVLGASESVTAAEALAMFTGRAMQPASPRRVEVGAVADLCVLSCSPAEVCSGLDAGAVAATVVAGEMVYVRG